MTSPFTSLYLHSRNIGTSAALSYIYWLTAKYINQHFEGGNMLYADGHVKWVRQSATRAIDYGITANTGPACGNSGQGVSSSTAF